MSSELRVDSLKTTSGQSVMTFDGSGKVTFSNTSTGSNILEKVGGLCDGSTRTTKSGSTFTLPTVTEYQLINTATYTLVTGSSVSYTAPTGCIGVLYEFLHTASWNSGSHAIQHYRLYIDGVEPVYARRTHAATYMESKPMCTWYFKIDSSLSSIDTNTGAVPSWTSARSLSWQSRYYAGGNNVSRMHGTQYFDGGGTNTFHMPQVWITAFGAS
tara:strand:+ start:489 stop:1130 length:642 start_codon:yes stop_codon:yes gene_type:complete